MRNVAGEFKNIQAGEWVNSPAGIPSGAAARAINVDFPSTGGVRTRRAFEFDLRDGYWGGAPDEILPIKDAKGRWYTRPGDIVTTDASRVAQGGPFLPSSSMILLGDDILHTHAGGGFSLTPVEHPGVPSGITYIEVASGMAGVTYKVTAKGKTAQWTTPSATSAGSEVGLTVPELDLTSIEKYSGAQTRREHNGTYARNLWEPDPEFGPEYLSIGARWNRDGSRFTPKGSMTFQSTISEVGDMSPLGGGHTLIKLHEIQRNPPPEWTDRNAPYPVRGNQLTEWGFANGDEASNSWRPIIHKDSPLRNRDLWARYTYVARELSPAYNTEVQAANIRYQKALAAYQTEVVKRTSASHIATQLGSQLVHMGIVGHVQIKGSTIIVAGLTELSVSDTGPGNLLRLAPRKVASLADLPSRALNNDVLEVGGVPFQYSEASNTWKEVPAYNLQYSGYGLSWSEWRPDGTGPYHKHVTAGTGDHDIRMPQAGTRAFLDSVKGTHRPIQSFLWGARHIMVTTRGVWVSAVGAPLDFFPSTATAFQEDDGYYVPVTLQGSSEMVQAACLWGDFVVLATTQAIWRIGLGTGQQVTRYRVADVPCPHKAWLATTLMGVLLFHQDAAHDIRVSLLTASPEGNKVVPVPVLEHWKPDTPLRPIRFVTVHPNMRDLCVCMRSAGDLQTAPAYMITMGESPSVRQYTHIGMDPRMGYHADSLIMVARVSDRTYRMLKQGTSNQRDTGLSDPNPIKAELSLYPPPEFRVYAPDGRYVYRTFTVYPLRGDLTLEVANWSKAYQLRSHNLQQTFSLNVGIPNSSALSTVKGDAPWEIKAAQYTVLTRNGKTPGGW